MFPSAPMSIRAFASLGLRLGQLRVVRVWCVMEGVVVQGNMKDQHLIHTFHLLPTPAISTNGNGSGDVSHPPRRPTLVGPMKDD